VADEQLVYLDTSAFVKLAIPEPETAALIAAIPAQARLVASEILEVEALRAARRVAGEDGATAARTQLAGVRLLPLTDQIRGRACELEPATLRSLDAIHVATALDLGELLAYMYAYDARMASAASDAGIQVHAPMTETPTTEDAQTDDSSDPDAEEDPSPVPD
jgi:predicted nucleic acid-binding protein